MLYGCLFRNGTVSIKKNNNRYKRIPSLQITAIKLMKSCLQAGFVTSKTHVIKSIRWKVGLDLKLSYLFKFLMNFYSKYEGNDPFFCWYFHEKSRRKLILIAFSTCFLYNHEKWWLMIVQVDLKELIENRDFYFSSFMCLWVLALDILFPARGTTSSST